MTTRDIVLIGTGAVVGFFLMGYFNKPKQNSQEEIDQSKLEDCTKKVEDFMSRTQFKVSADFDFNEYKKNAIYSCIKGENTNLI